MYIVRIYFFSLLYKLRSVAIKQIQFRAILKLVKLSKIC